MEKIKEEFPEVEVIAGTATAGIPHGAIIADKMNLPFAYIRSKPKITVLVTKSKVVWLKAKKWLLLKT